jgi:hypothetical protein
MKWETKKPDIGTVRERRRFAWSPVEVGKYTVWLETYAITEELQLVNTIPTWIEINREPLFPAMV